MTRMRKLHSDAKVAQQRVKRLSEKLAIRTELNGIAVDPELHCDLSSICNDTASNSLILEKHPPGSFGHIFWEQQQKACSIKNPRSMKWHPLMIRWCIYLRHMSSSAYETLRASDVIKLPSQRTLRDYSYYTTAQAGFSASTDQQLLTAAKIESEKDKFVILLMDEMHIRDEIVYDKHSGMHV